MRQLRDTIRGVANTGSAASKELVWGKVHTVQFQAIHINHPVRRVLHGVHDDVQVRLDRPGRLDDGGCEVTCTILDQQKPLLAVSLRVADEHQAAQIKEHFLADPSFLYRANLAVLAGDASLRRAGTQLVIKL